MVGPKLKTEPFALRQCVFTDVVVDNIRGRFQPARLSLTGIKGDFIVVVSTTQKFPTEQQNQGIYHNEPNIDFSTVSPGQSSKADSVRFTA